MLKMRRATAADVLLYHRWANEEEVRKQSFRREPIPYDVHVQWFNRRREAPDCLLAVFENGDGQPVGQVRIESVDGNATISVSVDNRFRGLGYGTEMLRACTAEYQAAHTTTPVYAHIRPDNSASINAFTRAGYRLFSEQHDRVTYIKPPS